MNIESVSTKLQSIGLDLGTTDLANIIEGDVKIEFLSTVESLVDILCDFHPDLNNVCAPDELTSEAIESFTFDLTDILRRLECPYNCLVDGPLSDRLKNKALILSFLASEIQAAKMNVVADSKGQSFHSFLLMAFSLGRNTRIFL